MKIICPKCKLAIAACVCAGAVLYPTAGHAGVAAHKTDPVATYYHASPAWYEGQPDGPHFPEPVTDDPFVPYIATGTASVSLHGPIPDLYGS